MNKENKKNNKKRIIGTIVAILLVAFLLFLLSLLRGCHERQEDMLNGNGIKWNWNLNLDDLDDNNSNSDDKNQLPVILSDEKAEEETEADEKISDKSDKKSSVDNTQNNDSQKPNNDIKPENPEENPDHREGDEEILHKLSVFDLDIQLPKDRVYSGKPILAKYSLKEGVTANVSVKYYGKKLVNDKPVDVGSYSVIFTAKGTGKFEGTIKIKRKYSIVPKLITQKDLKVKMPSNRIYDGTDKEVTAKLEKVTGRVTVTYTGKNLILGKPVNTGSYIAHIKAEGTGNYAGVITVTKKFTIVPKTIKESDITVSEPTDKIYDTTAKEVSVNFVGNVTGECTVSYEGPVNEKGMPVNAGMYTAVISITGTGNYTGTITIRKDFTILPKTLQETDVTVEAPYDDVWNGSGKRVVVTLKDGVTADVDVSYEGDVNEEDLPENAGEYVAVVTLTGKGNYKETITKRLTFWIKKDKYDESGIQFPSKEFFYNSERVYRLEVTGTPNGVEVYYENNDKTEIGEYEVIAHFVGDKNHEPIEDRKATMTIKAKSEEKPGDGENQKPGEENPPTTNPNPGEGEQPSPGEGEENNPEENPDEGDQIPPEKEEDKNPSEGEQIPPEQEGEKNPDEGQQTQPEQVEQNIEEGNQQSPITEEDKKVEETNQQDPPATDDVSIKEGAQKNPMLEEEPEPSIIEGAMQAVLAIVNYKLFYFK